MLISFLNKRFSKHITWMCFFHASNTRKPQRNGRRRRHENFQLSSFSLADFQRKLEDSGRWLDSGKITKRFFKKLGWSCRGTQPWKRQTPPVSLMDLVEMRICSLPPGYHRFCSKRHAMAILHGLFLGAGWQDLKGPAPLKKRGCEEEGDTPSLKLTKRP